MNLESTNSKLFVGIAIAITLGAGCEQDHIIGDTPSQAGGTSALGGVATGGIASTETGGTATGGIASVATGGAPTGGVASTMTGSIATGGVACGTQRTGGAGGAGGGSNTGGTATGGVASEGTGGTTTGNTSAPDAGECGDPAVLSRFDQCTASASDQSSCETAGGTWHPSLLGTPFCTCPTGQGSCPCNKSSQCRGSCIAGPLTNDDCASITVGLCASETGPLGCLCLFHDESGIATTVCVD